MSATTEPSAPTDCPSARATSSAVAQAIAVGTVAVALIWAYWTDICDLVRVWINDPNYSHGFLVLPVAALIFWRRWPRGEDVKLKPSWLGFAALAAVIGLRALFYEMGEFWMERVTVLLSVAALVLAYGGWPLFRRVWPAVAFLVFMFTVPAALQTKLSLPMQRVASWASCSLLRLLGLWVMNEGNVIIVGSDQLEVAAACNGLAMLMSLAAVISAALTLIPLPMWKRVVLLFSILPIAILCNILRISATVWCHYLTSDPKWHQGIHDWAGLAMMPLALFLVWLELRWMSWLVKEEEVVMAGPLIGIRTASS
jgi:exosortase